MPGDVTVEQGNIYNPDGSFDLAALAGGRLR
jgi:hypothetical protein